MQVPDIFSSFSGAGKQPNGDSPHSSHSSPSLLVEDPRMDSDLSQQVPGEDPQIRIAQLETKCRRLTSKLEKAQSKRHDVSKFLDLYQQKCNELEKTRMDYSALIETSEESHRLEVHRLTAILQETEKARSSADQHIAEQSILVSQLQAQLRDARTQLASSGDSVETKKELTKLKSDLLSRDRIVSKRDEKIEMQKLEIANLHQQVKILERNMKQARENGFIIATPQSATASSLSAPSTAVSSPSYAPNIPLPHIEPPKKRTRVTSRAKKTKSAILRSDEEDEEMAAGFMEDYAKDLVLSSGSETSTTKGRKMEESDDDLWTPPAAVNAPTSSPKTTPPEPTISSTRTRRKLPETRPPNVPTNFMVPDSVLMPPPSVSATVPSRPVAQPSNQLIEAPSNSFMSNHTTSLVLPPQTSSPSANTSSTPSPSMKQPNYLLQPVTIYWKPLNKVEKISTALGAVLSPFMHSSAMDIDADEIRRSISEVAGQVCCASPRNLSKAILHALHATMEPLSLQWNSHLLCDSEMMSIVSTGGCYENSLVTFILTASKGMFSCTQSQFIETLLSMLIQALKTGSLSSVSGNKDMSDFMASAFVRLYIVLCREFGLLLRARSLIFDLLREKEEICLLQLLGGLFAWPLIVEVKSVSKSTSTFHDRGTSGQTSALPQNKNFVSCTIEAILTAALDVSEGAIDPLTQTERQFLGEKLGWKLENRPNLLEKWTSLVIGSFAAHLTTNTSDSARYIAVGVDMIQSMELLFSQLGWQFCVSQAMQPLLWPSILSLPSQFASEDSTLSASSFSSVSLRASLLVKAIGSLSKIGLESGHSSPSPSSFLLHWLSIGSPVPFTIQLQAVQALLGIHLSSTPNPSRFSDVGNIISWFSKLPPLQRRYIPAHLEHILASLNQDGPTHSSLHVAPL